MDKHICIVSVCITLAADQIGTWKYPDTFREADPRFGVLEQSQTAQKTTSSQICIHIGTPNRYQQRQNVLEDTYMLRTPSVT
jgi:hypothetical protein